VVFVNPGVAIGDQDQIRFEGPILPAISPGPTVPPPAAPGIASVGPAGLPLLAEIPVIGQPDSVGGNVLPGSTGGSTIASPAATSDEGTVDTESARRAAQQAESSDSGTSGGDGALVALAGDGAEGQSVVCPAGVAPGTKLKRRDAGGKETTVTCK